MSQRLEAMLLVASSILCITNIVAARNISIVGDHFILDGKRLQIISGSVHYFRTPAEYWRNRLLKAKAAGLNAIATYVEWSFHEPEERQYRFEGDQDVAAFIRTAAEVGLLVLLRAGPYICAERDLGGLPYWLFSKYPKIKLRTVDKDFLNETETWMKKLFEQLSTLLYGNGGPIILVQVENEYGSFGNNKNYKVLLRNIIQAHVGSKALLYTTDGSGIGYIRNGHVPGALSTVDFGPGGDIEGAFKDLRKFMPTGPLMNSEFYTGWLTHWGESFSRGDTNALVNGLDHMIKYDKNVNFYVFYGGTNFEFSAGANTQYTASITSYDYDAPVSEAGDMTHKYWAIRELMIKHYPDLKNITPPAEAKKGKYGKVRVGNGLILMSAEGRSKLGKFYGAFESGAKVKLPTFEQLRQRAGLMLYEIKIDKDYPEVTLKINDPRDRVYIFVDEQYKGLIDRNRQIHSIILKNIKITSRISLLCENQGRINFAYLGDVKGIRQVKLNGTILVGKWNVTGYPLQNTRNITGSTEYQLGTESGPVLYNGTLLLPEGQKPFDTFIDTSGWGKGYVWVNGHNLGRYWPGRGPQVTLYVPGVWLRAAPAHNTVQLLELERPADHLTIDFIDYPILNRTHKDSGENIFYTRNTNDMKIQLFK